MKTQLARSPLEGPWTLRESLVLAPGVDALAHVTSAYVRDGWSVRKTEHFAAGPGAFASILDHGLVVGVIGAVPARHMLVKGTEARTVAYGSSSIPGESVDHPIEVTSELAPKDPRSLAALAAAHVSTVQSLADELGLLWCCFTMHGRGPSLVELKAGVRPSPIDLGCVLVPGRGLFSTGTAVGLLVDAADTPHETASVEAVWSILRALAFTHGAPLARSGT